MNVEDFLGPIDLRAGDRWEAIDELLDFLVAIHKIQDHDRPSIAARVKKRESTMSTGIGYGIAIPHASTELIADGLAVVGRSRGGIQFDAIDGKPVDLVVLFLVPERRFQPYVHTLANLAKLLQTEDFRSWLKRQFL